MKRKSVSFNDFGGAEKTTGKPTNAGILKMDSAPTIAQKTPIKSSLDDFLNDFDDD